MTKKAWKLAFVNARAHKTLFFLQNPEVSGKSMSSKEQAMAAFGRGTLATALATAVAVVAPVLAQENTVAGKPAANTTITQPEEKVYLVEQVAEYSESHPVVAIGIFKGKKDPITGEKIGDTLSNALTKIHDAPSKYFVKPGDDYTTVIFAVDGHIYGPYGLKESLSGLSIAADSYNERVKVRSAPGATAAALAGKPEPQQ